MLEMNMTIAFPAAPLLTVILALVGKETTSAFNLQKETTVVGQGADNPYWLEGIQHFASHSFLGSAYLFV